jgi:hypothetical protein
MCVDIVDADGDDELDSDDDDDERTDYYGIGVVVV